MGVFADLLAQKKTFKTGSQLASALQSHINSKVDPTIGSAAAVANAVHTLAESTQTSGNFTLTVTLRNGETFTTGNVAFDDVAATVEGLIDTAATAASITDWTNGDIAVTGTAVNDGGLIFTFSGDSVAGVNHPITVLTDVDGAGGDWGAISITTPGQTARPAWGVLLAMGVISGTLPAQTDVASASSVTVGANYTKVPGWLVRVIAREAAAEDDNNASYHSIIAAVGYEDRAPLAQYVGTSDHV